MEEIVFAALIDDADKAVLGRTFVGDDLVDLSWDQRRFIPLVVDADGKALSHGRLLFQVSLDLDVPATHTMGLIPVKLDPAGCAIRESHLRDALELCFQYA